MRQRDLQRVAGADQCRMQNMWVLREQLGTRDTKSVGDRVEVFTGRECMQCGAVGIFGRMVVGYTLNVHKLIDLMAVVLPWPTCDVVVKMGVTLGVHALHGFAIFLPRIRVPQARLGPRTMRSKCSSLPSVLPVETALPCHRVTAGTTLGAVRNILLTCRRSRVLRWRPGGQFVRCRRRRDGSKVGTGK